MHEQGFKASSTRDAIRTYAQEKKGFSDETWQQFAKCLSFVRGDLDAPSTEEAEPAKFEAEQPTKSTD